VQAAQRFPHLLAEMDHLLVRSQFPRQAAAVVQNRALQTREGLAVQAVVARDFLVVLVVLEHLEKVKMVVQVVAVA
jgi:hypothetical protein